MGNGEGKGSRVRPSLQSYFDLTPTFKNLAPASVTDDTPNRINDIHRHSTDTFVHPVTSQYQTVCLLALIIFLCPHIAQSILPLKSRDINRTQPTDQSATDQLGQTDFYTQIIIYRVHERCIGLYNNGSQSHQRQTQAYIHISSGR